MTPILAKKLPHLRLGPRLILDYLVCPPKLHDSVYIDRSAGFVLNVSTPSPRKSFRLRCWYHLILEQRLKSRHCGTWAPWADQEQAPDLALAVSHATLYQVSVAMALVP